MNTTKFGQFLGAWAVLALTAAPLQAASAEGPDGDQLLKRVCAKLSAARCFTFEAQREIDAPLLQGQSVPEKARITAKVLRPNQLTTQSLSKAGTRRIVFDGRSLSLLDGGKNTYAVVPMRRTLDGLVAHLEEAYDFTPPLAEFALSDPYENFHRQARTVAYSGREKVSGGFLGLTPVDCHRLSLKGKQADAELWVGAVDLLPRKLIATFHRPGNPQVRISFSKWNLTATPAAGDFAFAPPKGAEKVEMWTTARMEAAAKN